MNFYFILLFDREILFTGCEGTIGSSEAISAYAGVLWDQVCAGVTVVAIVAVAIVEAWSVVTQVHGWDIGCNKIHKNNIQQ